MHVLLTLPAEQGRVCWQQDLCGVILLGAWERGDWGLAAGMQAQWPCKAADWPCPAALPKQEMASRHRVRAPCLQIIKTATVPAALTKRVNVKQFHDSKIQFPLTRRMARCGAAPLLPWKRLVAGVQCWPVVR